MIFKWFQIVKILKEYIHRYKHNIPNLLQKQAQTCETRQENNDKPIMNHFPC